MKLEIACADEHDMLDWIDKIRMCANNAQQMVIWSFLARCHAKKWTNLYITTSVIIIDIV